jgi:hypothetical protein
MATLGAVNDMAILMNHRIAVEPDGSWKNPDPVIGHNARPCGRRACLIGIAYQSLV